VVKAARFKGTSAMSDDNFSEIKEQWEIMLSSGQPLHQVKVDLPMTVIREEAGGLAIDTATFSVAGFDRLGVLRVHLTPLAVDRLKWAFRELEKNPDTPSVKIQMPTSN
jgi:hypothetical protein